MEGLAKEKGKSKYFFFFLSWVCDHRTHIRKEEKGKSKQKKKSRVYQRSASFFHPSFQIVSLSLTTGEEKKGNNKLRGLNGGERERQRIRGS